MVRGMETEINDLQMWLHEQGSKIHEQMDKINEYRNKVLRQEGKIHKLEESLAALSKNRYPRELWDTWNEQESTRN